MKEVTIRSISGLLFMAVIIACILWCSLSFAILFGIVAAFMVNEYLNINALPEKNIRSQKAFTIATALVIFYSFYIVQSGLAGDYFYLISLFMIIIMFVKNLFIKNFNVHKITKEGDKVIRENNGYEMFPVCITSLIYIAIPVALLNMIVFSNNGIGEYSGTLLLSFFIILWSTDVGAYCFGSTLGQKIGPKLFPSISPKKSWVGLIGGLICAIIAGIILNYYDLLNFNLTQSIIVSVILCIGGVLGDLVESQLKRNFGIKDSGKIIPGHGGMLDRFDSMLIAFPLALIYIVFFIK